MPSILDRLSTGPQTPTSGPLDKPEITPVVDKVSSTPVTKTDASGTMFELKDRIQTKLLAELDIEKDIVKTEEVKKRIQVLFQQILDEEKIPLSKFEKGKLFEQIIAEIMGYGPLEPLLQDETITEIMVNGATELFIERDGKLVRLPNLFESNEHLMRIIEKIVAPLGRRIDETSPYVDARLPDGSRVNAVIPPISLIGPVLTIRKFAKNPITIEKLIQLRTLSPDAAFFIKACVEAKINILVSGGTGSGKTTLLNVLSSFIPDDERIITIENAAELQLRQEHIVTLESRPINIEGKGEVTIRELVTNSLRMRPDRIIVGEIRDGAALDMLQAMNTGHDGSMSTLHSNSPKDTMARLETMVLMAGMDLPARAIREQICSAINLVIHIERMRDGTRKITSISEVLGIVDGNINIADIFKFENQGYHNGKLHGQLKPTGYCPVLLEKIEAAGISFPVKMLSTGVLIPGNS